MNSTKAELQAQTRFAGMLDGVKKQFNSSNDYRLISNRCGAFDVASLCVEQSVRIVVTDPEGSLTLIVMANGRSRLNCGEVQMHGSAVLRPSIVAGTIRALLEDALHA